MQVNLLGNVVDDRTGTVNIGFEVNDLLSNVRFRGDVNVSLEEYKNAFSTDGVAPLVMEKLSKAVVGEDSVSKGVVMLKEEISEALQKLTMELTMMIVGMQRGEEEDLMPPIPAPPEVDDEEEPAEEEEEHKDPEETEDSEEPMEEIPEEVEEVDNGDTTDTDNL